MPAENLHVTLAFLDGLPDADAAVDALRAAAAECAPAEVRLGMLDGFPSSRRARVVWVSLADPSGALQHAAVGIRGALQVRVGFSVDQPFVPHITIARIRRGVQPVEVPPVPVAPLPFTISSVELFESVLRGGRPPRYVELASIPFSGGARSARSS